MANGQDLGGIALGGFAQGRLRQQAIGVQKGQLDLQKQTQLQAQANKSLEGLFDSLKLAVDSGAQQNLTIEDPALQKAVAPIMAAIAKTAVLAEQSGTIPGATNAATARVQALLSQPTAAQVATGAGQAQAAQRAGEARALRREGVPAVSAARTAGVEIAAPETGFTAQSVKDVSVTRPVVFEETPADGGGPGFMFADMPTPVRVPQGQFRILKTPTVQFTGEEAGLAVQKKTAGKIEDKILAINDQLDALERVEQDFDPEFLTSFGRLKAVTLKAIDKNPQIFGDLSPESKSFLERQQRFFAGAMEQLNLYIKNITGAQMSELEASRLRMVPADVQNDSPTTFVTKLKRALIVGRAARERYQQALTRGLINIGDPVNNETAKALDKAGLRIENFIKPDDQSTRPEFNSPDDVKAAVNRGDISRDQGIEILRQQFAFE